MQDATYRGSEPKRWRKQVNLVLAVATVVAVLAVTTTLGGTGFAAIG